MKKIILFALPLFLCVLLFSLTYKTNDVEKYLPSKNTFESENFYVDSIITINQLDEEQKNNNGINTEFISFDITFNLIPKDDNRVFYNIKVDAFINDDISNLLLVPSQVNIKSYSDYGADIGKGMETFALSLGKLNWINQETFNALNMTSDILEKDVKVEVTWKDGAESFVIPSEYLTVIIRNKSHN